MIFSHLTDFSLENTMFLSIYVVFLHFPGIPGNFFGISRISRFPGKKFGPGNRPPYSILQKMNASEFFEILES